MSVIRKAQARAADITSVENRLKSEIEEIIRAYRHSWDIYSEILQNSVDAINRRYRILNDPDFYLYESYRQQFSELESNSAYVGRIQITVNTPERTIEVMDNGVGILPEKVEDFLLPKGGDKPVAYEYGFKGYGLTFVAFISTEFRIMSRPFLPFGSDAHELHLNGLFDWVADEKNTVSFPSSPIPDISITSDLPIEWNTAVKVKLAEDYTIRFPAISSAEKAVELAECGWTQLDNGTLHPYGFEYILRTRTALGNTKPLFNQGPKVSIEITLNIIGESNEITNITIPYRYFHPREHEEVKVSTYDFEDYYQNYKRPSSGRDFRGLYHAVADVTVGTRRSIECQVALAAISSTRLSNIEASLGLQDLDTGDIDVSYGIHLAIDGMPTGLRIDDWDMRGHYLKRYFVVVDAELDVSNQLDPGRKGISRHYAKLISDKVLNLLNITVEDSAPFSQYASRHLNHGRGREEGGLPPQDFLLKVEQAREQQAEDQNERNDILRKIKMFSSLTRIPRDEQEVIALFHELRSHNIIKGYQVVYLSSRAVYDSAFEYQIECTTNNIFPNDPLGIGRVLVQDLRSTGETVYRHDKHYAGITTHPELCVDYKRNVGAFLEEIMSRSGTSNKDPNLIDLLIVWNTVVPASISSTLYTIDPIPDNQRKFHSATHRIGLIGQHYTELWCISLERILEAIPFLDDSQ
jgi:hypothetical protein